ncbi:tetratricopeptide repeat protein [Rheinheimera sp.]|uniref:tetratricopeptide repeat protein n=1 Tax=Rheinheimera sp. TaxID=1869214 RepID=UPI0023522346|nr:tetratricopeptide repeat protein [Rheinheimera sp.]
MSVLNKMLRDLEKRQHVSEHAVTALNARSDERPLWLNLLLLLSALLLAFAVYAILTREPLPDTGEAASELVKPVKSDTAAAVTAADNSAELSVSTKAVALASQQSAAVISAEPGLAETEAEQGADSVLAEDTKAGTGSALPSTDTAPPVAEPNAAQQPQPLPAEHDSAALQAASAEGNTEPRTNVQPETEVKVVRSVATPQQQAALLQQRALTAAQAGQLQQALQLWQQLQQLTPQNAEAYLEQARLWHQLGQPQQALTVLQQALQQGIVNADIQLLLAQQAAAQAQWPRVEALLPAQFVLAQQPEYYGLKATALQQLGQPQAALDWFRQLIVLQPQQARWWLGAAIALDALAQREQAQLHYRQALQWGDSLTAASRNYIQQRLAATE